MISEWAEGNVWEAILDANWDDVSIIGEDALGASSNLDGLVIDVILVPFQLARGMDCLALSGVCILMHDGNCWPMLGFDDPPAVTMGILVIWWLSIPLTSTVRSDFSMIRMSSPAMPPLAPLSTSEPTFQDLWEETE